MLTRNSSAVIRLGVGADAQVLTADSAESSGLKYTRAATAYRIIGKSTWFYFSQVLGSSDTTVNPAQSTLVAYPFMFDNDAALDRVSLEVTTTAVSSTIRLGLYLAGTDGLPGALYRDFGTIDSATSTGIKTITISETIPRALYWICAVSQGGLPTSRGRSVANAFVPQQTGGNVNSLAVTVGSVTGALPDPFGSPSQYQLNVPKIGFRAT